MKTDKSIFYKKLLFFSLYSAIVWFYLIPIFVLLSVVSTIKTLIFLFWVIWLCIIPWIYIIKWRVNKKFLSIIAILFVIILLNWFQPNNAQDGQFSLTCLNCSKYNYNILNAISERELLDAWYRLAWMLWITKEQLRLFKDIELQYEDRVQINLPSQMPNAILNYKENKYIIYKPNNLKTNKIIFVLHWSAWWFLFYQKFFKQFADKYNIAVVTPVFGWGNWNEPWWVNLFFDTYKDLMNKWVINKQTEVILFWLSNGWVGLTRVIYFDNDNIFSKIMYISWVMEKEIMQTKRFQDNLAHKQIFTIQWEIDDRVTYSNYLDCKKYLWNIQELIFPDWDHFILLNKDKQVVEEIEKMIERK